jgi:predicted nuclease with TOPRIM domain
MRNEKEPPVEVRIEYKQKPKEPLELLQKLQWTETRKGKNAQQRLQKLEETKSHLEKDLQRGGKEIEDLKQKMGLFPGQHMQKLLELRDLQDTRKIEETNLLREIRDLETAIDLNTKTWALNRVAETPQKAQDLREHIQILTGNMNEAAQKGDFAKAADLKKIIESDQWDLARLEESWKQWTNEEELPHPKGDGKQ